MQQTKHEDDIRDQQQNHEVEHRRQQTKHEEDIRE